MSNHTDATYCTILSEPKLSSTVINSIYLSPLLLSSTGILCPLLYIFAEYMNDIPVTILLLLLAFMGCLVGGPNNIITSAVAADLADDPSIKGNNKVHYHHRLQALFTSSILYQSYSTTLDDSYLLMKPILFSLLGLRHRNWNHQRFRIRDSGIGAISHSNSVQDGSNRQCRIPVCVVLPHSLHGCGHFSALSQDIQGAVPQGSAPSAARPSSANTCWLLGSQWQRQSIDVTLFSFHSVHCLHTVRSRSLSSSPLTTLT